MKTEINFESELVDSLIEELEEALDILCPVPKSLPLTENICNACRFQDICEKVHKVSIILQYAR